jgi:hypothetical protein
MLFRTEPLDSTVLASAQRVVGATVVTFTSGERYLVECSRATHKGLMFADSPGSYYNRVMRSQGRVFRILHGNAVPFDVVTLLPARR